jgi:pimeloyl-ACP methyl ester carboxylesterase
LWFKRNMPSLTTSTRQLDPLEDLHRFRASHALSQTLVDGIQWKYIACGRGDETLLMLPGAPGRAETAFQHILALEGDYRIIAPSYPPPLSTMRAMLAGLAGIMRAEQVEKAHVIGGSYSGLVAQSFVRRFPAKVSTLVMSDTGVPRRDRAKRYARYLRIVEALPLPAIRALWRLGAYLYLREIPLDKPFWRAYFRELISTITKQECIGRLKIWIEFDRHSRFTPHDLDPWPGKILILQAEADLTFPLLERAALRKLYPQAQTITFPHGGHAASITHRGQYMDAIIRFLTVPYLAHV